MVVAAVIALVVVLASRAYGAPGYDADDLLDGDTPSPADRSDRDDADAGEREHDGDIRIAPCDCDEAVLAATAARAPSLPAVIAATHRAAGLAGDPAPSWRRRSQLSSLIPSLAARGGNSESWRDISDPTVSHHVTFDVRAAWRLDRLVFDPTELRIASLDVQRRREKRRLASLASRWFFAWLRAQSAARRDPQWQLAADHARAELDILTDRWFSQALSKML